MITNHQELINSLMRTVVTLSEEYYAEPSELIEEIDNIIPMSKVDRREILAFALNNGYIDMPVSHFVSAIKLSNPVGFILQATMSDQGIDVESTTEAVPILALVGLRFRLEGMESYFQ